MTAGAFPSSWKEALLTPVLKKGDPSAKENYRPVSCLSAASKVLEVIVCDQVTFYLESNGLFPQNQHGFSGKEVYNFYLGEYTTRMGSQHRTKTKNRRPSLGPKCSF